MLNISYTRIADLIADFKAGVKFVIQFDHSDSTVNVTEIVETADRGFRVTTSTATYRAFRLDGTNRLASGMRLMKAEAIKLAPWARAGYKSFKAMKEDFEAGLLELRVVRGGNPLTVTRIDSVGDRTARLTADGLTYGHFNPEGGNRNEPWTLEARKKPAPVLTDVRLSHPTAQPTPVPAPAIPAREDAPVAPVVPQSAIGWPYPTGSGQTTLAPETKKTFLELVLNGQTFHNPKTGEVVEAVNVRVGHRVLEVTLKDPETGKTRVTPRYNLDGTHKFQKDRNLAAGKPPKRPKQVKVVIYKHAFNGTLFVIREGEVLPNIRGISNATKVGNTTVTE